MTSDDVDARFMLFYPNPFHKGYIIYPRKYYLRLHKKDPNGDYWPEGSVLGVVASDDDFGPDHVIYPDGKTPNGTGKGQSYDISDFIPFDRLFFLVVVGSDLVHISGSGAHTVLSFMFDVMAQIKIQSGPRVSPVDWIRRYAVFKNWPDSIRDAHLDALFAYLLHPVPRIVDKTQRPFTYLVENLVRYHADEVIDGFSIKTLVAAGLGPDSLIRNLIIEEPFAFSRDISKFSFRRDHSCSDKHPERPPPATIVAQHFRDNLPPINLFVPVYSIATGVNPQAPKMDLQVLFDYVEKQQEKLKNSSGSNGMPYVLKNSLSRGNARSIAMLVQENSDPKKKEFLKFYVDPDYRPMPNGPLGKMWIFCLVPRYYQQTEYKRVYWEAAYGLLWDVLAGGDILKVTAILQHVCDESCTLGNTADGCAHFVNFV